MPNTSGTPDKTDELFRGLMAAHTSLIGKVTRVGKSPIDPGAFVDEYQSENGPTCSFQIQGDRSFLIQTIIYSFTPIAAATLIIGQTSGTNRNIPIPATSLNVPMSLNCAMILKPGDYVTLNCPGATSSFLEIMGKVLSGTDWSVT